MGYRTRYELSAAVIEDRIIACLAAALDATTDKQSSNCVKYALIYMEEQTDTSDVE